MPTCSPTSVLQIGKVAFFSKQLEVKPKLITIPGRWKTPTAKFIDQHNEALQRGYPEVVKTFDIHTPLKSLQPENVVVHAGFGRISQPNGVSAGWLIELKDIRIVDRNDPAGTFKTIRISCRLYTTGNPKTQITRVHVFGFAAESNATSFADIVSSETAGGPPGNLVPFNRMRVGNTLLFSEQNPAGANNYVSIDSPPGAACEDGIACLVPGYARSVMKPQCTIDGRITSQERTGAESRFEYALNPTGRYDGEILRPHALGVISKGGRAFSEPIPPNLGNIGAPIKPSAAVVYRDEFYVFRHVLIKSFQRTANMQQRVLEIQVLFASVGKNPVVHVTFQDIGNRWVGGRKKNWDVEILGVDITSAPIIRIHYELRAYHYRSAIERLAFFGIVRNASAPLVAEDAAPFT